MKWLWMALVDKYSAEGQALGLQQKCSIFMFVFCINHIKCFSILTCSLFFSSPYFGEEFYFEIPRTFQWLSFYIYDKSVLQKDLRIGRFWDTIYILRNVWLFSVSLSAVLRIPLLKCCIFQSTVYSALKLNVPLKFEKQDFVSLLYYTEICLFFRLIGHFIVLWSQYFFFLNSICFFSTAVSLEYLNNCHYL